MDLNFFVYNYVIAVLALICDGVMGDPKYACHPVRIIGKTLQLYEQLLFKPNWNKKVSGILLGLLLLLTFLCPYFLFRSLLSVLPFLFGILFDLILAYHFIALRDLIAHSSRIQTAIESGNLTMARHHSSQLVGRDSNKMDLKSCGRAAIESVSENSVDGVLSPLFYLLLFGIPGMLVFKIASTMDSMVGYKNARYLLFGWFGARFDDALNYLPARLSWVLISFCSFLLPGYSSVFSLKIGWRQHHIIPGPNSGWAEAAFAGALRLKLCGPIYSSGKLVTDIWLGNASDREGAASQDIKKAHFLFVSYILVFTAAWGMGLYFF